MPEEPAITGLDLFIVRHAVAFERDSARWADDCDRPLTRKGERSFRRAARGLQEVARPVETVLASPCVRAWRTAELLADESGWGDPRPLEALGPDVDAAAALAALAEWGSSERLAIVGHEPMLGMLCGVLSGGATVELKKGAVARLAVRALAPGGATLRWLLPPKVLHGMSR
jgi:phosphohistidine phosphatase